MTARGVIGGVALVVALTAPLVQAQPRAMFVVLDTAGQPRVLFEPRASAIANPEAVMPPVSMPVPSTARMPDGMTVVGIAFNAWVEGSQFRVVAFALVRKEGD